MEYLFPSFLYDHIHINSATLPFAIKQLDVFFGQKSAAGWVISLAWPHMNLSVMDFFRTCWLISMLACCSLPSLAQDQRVPLSPRDRVLLDESFTLGIRWTPRLTKSIDGRKVVLGAVLFDGTLNDHLNVPRDERPTVVAHIKTRLQDDSSAQFVHYYKGAGTQDNPIVALADAAMGFTVKDTAEHAVEDVIAAIELLLTETQDADVRLLVSGFSRGGAAARHFMHLLERRWKTRGEERSSLRFYALIFDTVATGQENALLLQVPSSADLFYHFVSRDERRVFFKPIVDIQQDDLPNRIATIHLPGSHSDVGGSYIDGVGSEYLANIDALLMSMGLLQQRCVIVNGDARSQGKNDSRWVIERLLLFGAPNTKEAPASRKATFVYADPGSSDISSNWTKRMHAMGFDDAFSIPRCTIQRGLLTPEFMVTRNPQGYEINSLPPINLPSSRIHVEDGHYFLTYTFDGIALSKIEVSEAVRNRIPEMQSAKLSLAVVEEPDGGHHFWWFVDDILVQRIGGTFR